MSPLFTVRALRTGLLAAACALAAPAVSAFSVFAIDANHSLKWGDNQNGTPGGTVRWSFIAAGTDGAAYCGDACPGQAVSSLNIENSPGTGYTLTPLANLTSFIQATFDQWSAVADIRFLGPDPDSGLPINDANAGIPEIRIGVFAFASGGGAVGFAPPPNGGTGAGDILFDANSFYAFQPGNDGDAFPAASTAPNDFVSLLLHEMGHAIGLAHPAPGDSSCQVMDVSGPCLGRINRVLDADDIAGAQFLYGAAPVPVPGMGGLTALALAGLCAARGRRVPRRQA